MKLYRYEESFIHRGYDALDIDPSYISDLDVSVNLYEFNIKFYIISEYGKERRIKKNAKKQWASLKPEEALNQLLFRKKSQLRITTRIFNHAEAAIRKIRTMQQQDEN